MVAAESSGIMMKDSKNDHPAKFPKQPEGFHDVTCPVAQHLFLWLTSNCDNGFLIKTKHPHSSITAELFKNHINFTQARSLLDHADLRHPMNLQVLDWIAINGGGELALEHKYKLEKSFQSARDLAAEALEDYRSNEIYLENPKPSCDLEIHLGIQGL